MNGTEVEYSQEGDTWIAKEGIFVGRGRDKDEAARSLLEAKAGKPMEPKVSQQTLVNKVEIGQKLDAQVSRLMVRQLKHVTNEGMTHVAFYSDNPNLQGYGINENTAKLDLFKKQKEHQENK